MAKVSTAAELFVRNEASDDFAAHFEDESFTFRELAAESRRRAELWEQFRDHSKPPHIGVLLDNTPEYLFWLGVAAISRSAIVGVNATYRGAELARLIDHCDCQVLVTSDTYAAALAEAPVELPPERVLQTHLSDYTDALEQFDGQLVCEPASADDSFLLIFTSGSTGFPKAVRCTQGRFAATGRGGANTARLEAGKVVYAPPPMFHSSALFTGLSSALSASVPLGTRSRFSASRAMSDIQRMPVRGERLRLMSSSDGDAMADLLR